MHAGRALFAAFRLLGARGLRRFASVALPVSAGLSSTFSVRLRSLLVGTASLGLSALAFHHGGDADAAAAAPAPAGQKKGHGTEAFGLNPNEFRKFRVVSKTQVTRDTISYRIEGSGQVTDIDIPVASFILVRAKLGGEEVVRPYTPTCNHGPLLELTIKAYPQGKMSRHMASLKVGDEIEIKGPVHKYDLKPKMKRHIGMIAGGTGITPMMQVIMKQGEFYSHGVDKETRMSLLYANKTPDDILLPGALFGPWVQNQNFEAFFTVDKGPSSWDGERGFVSAEMIKKCMPPPGDGVLILICGPPEMMELVSGDKAKDKSQGPLKGLLKELGYTESMVYKY